MPRKSSRKFDAKDVLEARRIFSTNFARYRMEAELSQTRITELTGIAQSWISELENGKKTPRLDDMAILAKVIEVPLWRLLKPTE